MFLQEFITERNIKQSAVSMYLKRHEAEFEGHTELRDGKLWLDDVAVKLLSKKYPVIPPDDIWTPSAKKKYDEIQEELRESNKEVRQLNAENRELRKFELMYRALETEKQLLIEAAVAESQEELETAKEEIAEQRNRADAAEAKLEDTTAELAAMKSEVEKYQKLPKWKKWLLGIE